MFMSLVFDWMPYLLVKEGLGFTGVNLLKLICGFKSDYVYFIHLCLVHVTLELYHLGDFFFFTFS